MKRLTKNCLFSVVGLGMGLTSFTPANACGPGGGGYGGGGYSYSRPVYHAPAVIIRTVPVQHTVVEQQPFVQQQFVQQPGVQQRVVTDPSLQVPFSQNVGQQQFVGQQQGVGQQQLVGQQQFAGQQQVVGQQQFSGQQVVGQQPLNVQRQVIQQQQIPGQQSQIVAPQQQLPIQQPQQQLPVQQNPAGGNPEMTALQMLAEFSGDANVPQVQSQVGQPVFDGVGSFIAQLPNSSVVRLDLTSNGTFVWTAVANGKRSSFNGNFTMENGSLTLIRSNDNQQLSGSLNVSDNNGFTFKLNGTNDSGLKFNRS